MARPAYPTRPLAAGGVLPPLPRPPIAGPRAPIIPAVVRPAVVPSVASTEKQTTLYVGKIASTVENDFILSLLEVRDLINGIHLYNQIMIISTYSFPIFYSIEF